jgi:hypothetical protein
MVTPHNLRLKCTNGHGLIGKLRSDEMLRSVRNVFASVIAICALAGCHVPRALFISAAEVSGDGWSEPFRKALAAIKNQDCEAAWNTIWPLTKSGDVDAIKFLAETLRGGLTPPGEYRPSRELWDRYWLTIFVYATLSDKEFRLSSDISDERIQALTPRVIRHIRSDSEGERVAECFESTLAPKECVQLAIKLNVVSQFSVFWTEAETAVSESNQKAICLSSFNLPEPIRR